MSPEILIAFVVFAFTSSVTPGPNNLMLMASGINFGFRRTIPHMLGVAIGFTLMIVVVGAGLRQFFDLFPASYAILKWISIIYLIYLAYKIATSAAPPEKSENPTSKPFTFIQAALFQWVNPKAWTMGLTACSAYVPKDHPWAGLLFVAGVFGAINLPTVSSWAYLGVQMRQFLSDPFRLKAFNITAALLLLASLYPIIVEKAV